MSPADDPAWPSPPGLRRMLYWGCAPGTRPHDHVRSDIPELLRRLLAFLLQRGNDAHPSTGAMGWASCRICGADLGSRDLTAYGFVWPEKAEHYVLVHGVWTPDCTLLLRRAFAAQWTAS